MRGDDPATLECRFPGTMESVAEARSWLRGLLVKFEVPECAAENAVLVLSELATNSARHSCSAGPQGSYRVRLRRGVSCLRLEVTDAGGISEPRMRRNGTPDPWAESGNGLLLVEAVTTHWWTRSTAHGRTVGAELALNP